MFSEKHVSLNTCGVSSDSLCSVNDMDLVSGAWCSFGVHFSDFLFLKSTFFKIFTFFIVLVFFRWTLGLEIGIPGVIWVGLSGLVEFQDVPINVQQEK